MQDHPASNEEQISTLIKWRIQMLIMNNGKPLYRIFHQIAQYEEFSRNVLIFDPVSGAVINEDSTFNCTLPSMSRDINLYKLNELIIPYDHDASNISGFDLEPHIDFY